MNFELTEQQRLIQGGVREMIAREVPMSLVSDLEAQGKWLHRPLWDKMAEMGWLGLGLPSAYGGMDSDAVDQAVLCAELGRALAPTAYLSTIAPCARIVAAIGTEEQKQRLLPDVVAGRRLLTLALAEPDRPALPSSVAAVAVQDGAGFSLSGTKLFAYGGDGADTILWVARQGTGSLGIFLIDAGAPGVSIRPIPTLVPEGQVEISLSQAKVPREALLGNLADATPVLEQALEHAAMLKCVEVVSMGEVALGMAVAYVKRRVQYGKPIGAFQAMQHRLVNVWMELESASLAAWQGVWNLRTGAGGEEQRKIARLATARGIDRIALETTAAHGGLGYMEKYDLQNYTRRMLSAVAYIGTPGVNREALANAMAL